MNTETLTLEALPNARIKAFYDAHSGTLSYALWDVANSRAAIIDPVLDFSARSGHTSTACADQIETHVRAEGLSVDWILETHAHADHLSAARHLQRRLGGRIAIGEHIREVQATFKTLFNLERGFLPDGSQFDHLFKHGESFYVGTIELQAMLVPGHTPADMAYLLNGAAFVGDTLFMPDQGSARADFPGGDARMLYRSMRRLLELPPETRIFVCHDYPPSTRSVAYESTVAEQRAGNIHVRDGISEDAFVTMRMKRDATLDVPALILPALQVNVRAGELPPPDENGVRYLRIPLDKL
ncbi:MAG TPA: MBL fold metallo-hydrolase [Burkholderiaceae bacterium]|jgi:glyoxylase-like metal-dependent hydrolase (beta-lactamase superfamily II)